MIKIGEMNSLEIRGELPFAFELSNTENDPVVLLPNVLAPKNVKVGDKVDVFVYYNDDDQLTGTPTPPKVTLNQTRKLKAVGVTDFGAFFDWGLDRDLLVLKRDQERPIAEGLEYFVHVYHDENSDRLLGSTRLHYFHPEKVDAYASLKAQDPIEAKVYATTDLGYKVMINDHYLGLMFFSDSLRKMRVGESFSGFVKPIRSDGKIDVTTHIDNRKSRASLEQTILDDLEAHGGISSITDKSPPDEIFAHFKVSKGAYKKAIGTLYKQKRIEISKTSIKLVEK